MLPKLHAGRAKSADRMRRFRPGTSGSLGGRAATANKRQRPRTGQRPLKRDGSDVSALTAATLAAAPPDEGDLDEVRYGKSLADGGAPEGAPSLVDSLPSAGETAEAPLPPPEATEPPRLLPRVPSPRASVASPRARAAAKRDASRGGPRHRAAPTMLCQTMRSTSPRPKPKPSPRKADGSPRPSRLESLSQPRSPRAPSRRGGPLAKKKKTPVGFGSSSASVYLNAKLPANHAV